MADCIRITNCSITDNLVIIFNDRQITLPLDSYRYNVVKVLSGDRRIIEALIDQELGNNEYLLNV